MTALLTPAKNRASLADALRACLHPRTGKLTFARKWLKYEPHPGQIKWLTRDEKKINDLICGRGYGKSDILAMETIYTALFQTASEQLITSITVDQARISFDRMLQFCYESGLSELFDGNPKDTPFPTVKFRNRSVVTARASARGGLYIRGHEYNRVYVDEAAYVPRKVIEDAIMPTLRKSNKNTLNKLSTPAPMRDLLYEEMSLFQSGDETIYFQQGSSYENPHISKEQLDGMRATMTEAAYMREVFGQFASDDQAVFAWQYIQKSYEESNWDWNQQTEFNHRYVMGWDLAKEKDWTVGYCMDTTQKPYRLVAKWRWQQVAWPAQMQHIREAYMRYRPSLCLIDATGIGGVVLDELNDFATGFIFTAKSKVQVLMFLQKLLEKHELLFPFDKQTVDELQQYAWNDKQLVQDCVMALALTCWAAGPENGVFYVPNPWS